VAWRHSNTHSLHDSEDDVYLADGDSFAEPLYTIPHPAQEPEGWRVVYDGDSMPMVTDDIGRLFRVQQNLCGKWTHPHSPQELADRLAAPHPKEKS